MKKHWKTEAKRDGKPITLYVTSTDETIADDLALGEGASLTLIGRQQNFRYDPTPSTDHLDFACGAFVTVGHHEISVGGDVVVVDSIPNGLREHVIGGRIPSFIAIVYEQNG